MKSDKFALRQIEAPARRNPTLREDHAVAAIRRNFHFGCDRERLVLQIGRGALWQSNKRRIIYECLAPGSEAWSSRDLFRQSLHRAPVEWQNVVTRCFGPPEIDQLF